MADKIASINVVDTMARASNNIALQEEVFPVSTFTVIHVEFWA